MATFNWQNSLQNSSILDWLNTRGKGVKIAILDTGFDLAHPALAHLNKKKRLFSVGKTPIDTLILEGNDAVLDADGHGTATASILASKAAQTNQVVGFASEATFFLIKTTSESGDNRLIYLLNGLELAARLKVDLVIIPQAFRAAAWKKRDNLTDSQVENVFIKLEKSGAILLSSVKNLDDGDSWIDNPPADILPAGQKTSINVAFKPNNVADILEIKQLADLHFLIKNEGGLVCEIGGGYVDMNPSNSFSTAILGGIGACFLAFLKNKKLPRPSRAAFLKAISDVSKPLDSDGFGIFKNSLN
jgi:Subtilase family